MMVWYLTTKQKNMNSVSIKDTLNGNLLILIQLILCSFQTIAWLIDMETEFLIFISLQEIHKSKAIMWDVFMGSLLFLKNSSNRFNNSSKLTKINFLSKKCKIRKILEIRDISKVLLLLNVNLKKLMLSKKVFSASFMIWKKTLHKSIKTSWDLLMKRLNWQEFNLYKKLFTIDAGKFTR